MFYFRFSFSKFFLCLKFYFNIENNIINFDEISIITKTIKPTKIHINELDLTNSENIKKIKNIPQ